MINLQDFITDTMMRITIGINSSNIKIKDCYEVNPSSISIDTYVDENGDINASGKNKISLLLSINHQVDEKRIKK